MGLFKADLYRSLAIGFVVGAGLVVATLGIDLGTPIADNVAPQAVAQQAR